MDLPIPPGGPMEMLKDISHLEMASNSGKTSGTGTMKLVFTNKSKNSLSQILKMVKAVNTIVPGRYEPLSCNQVDKLIQIFNPL